MGKSDNNAVDLLKIKTGNHFQVARFLASFAALLLNDEVEHLMFFISTQSEQVHSVGGILT